MLSIRDPNCPFNGHSMIYMMYMPDFLLIEQKFLHVTYRSQDSPNLPSKN
jgi:hypothetical protein